MASIMNELVFCAFLDSILNYEKCKKKNLVLFSYSFASQ